MAGRADVRRNGSTNAELACVGNSMRSVCSLSSLSFLWECSVKKENLRVRSNRLRVPEGGRSYDRQQTPNVSNSLHNTSVCANKAEHDEMETGSRTVFYLLHQFAQPRLAWFSQQSQLAALHEGYRWAARPPRQWPRASRPHGKAFVKKIFTHPWSSRCIVFSPSFWGPVPRKPSIGMRSQRLRLRCCSGRESTSVCSPYSIFSLPCSPHFLTFFIASPSLTPSRNNDRPLQFVAGNANTGEDVVLSVGRSGPNRTLTDSSAYSTVIEHPTAHVLKQTHASTTDDWGLHTHRIPADSEQPQCR